MSRPITWLWYADEIAETPSLLAGVGFAVTESNDYHVRLDVYDFCIGQDDADLVCQLYVKWDGCSHMSMDKAECALHLCGASAWADTMDVIRRGAFTLAAKLVRAFDANLANWTDDRPLVEVESEMLPKVAP